jgi:peptidoglycan/LPS O-acetylase OafA/YrhL
MWDFWRSVTAEERPIAQTLAAGSVLSRVRIPELDGIRGIAILSVLAYHLFAFSMQLWEQQHGQPLHAFPKLVELVTWPGFLGVDVFFVLSGFLITGILLDTKNHAHFLRNFYVRRALRILPLYIVILVVIAVGYSNSGKFLLLSVFFLSNLATLLGITNIGPLWSLSIEEHFYLIWPWLVMAVSRRTLMIVAFSICAIEPIVRIAGFPLWGDGYFFSWTRFDGLAWGALVACFARSSAATPSVASKLCLTCLTAAAIVLLTGIPFGLLSRHNIYGAAFQYLPAQFFSMGLILAALGAPGRGVTNLLRTGALRLSGDLSYCLYLIHGFLMDGYDAMASRFYPAAELALGPFGALLVRAIAVLLASFGLALLSRRFLELPALRLRHYLERKRPMAVVTAL